MNLMGKRNAVQCFTMYRNAFALFLEIFLHFWSEDKELYFVLKMVQQYPQNPKVIFVFISCEVIAKLYFANCDFYT